MSGTIFTVGHSNGSFDHVMSLLRRHGVQTVIDIRTNPGSRHVPDFNRDVLEVRLPKEKISYRFRGDPLGGHPEDPSFYLDDGRVNFALVAQQPAFQQAIDGLVAGSEGPAPALFCKEADPFKCPRFFLIGPMLVARGLDVAHIRYQDGAGESHRDGEVRMLKEQGLDIPSLFGSEEENLKQAYGALKHEYDHRAPWMKKRS